MGKEVVYKPQQPYSAEINTPITQQKEYTLSFLEFASKNRQQITRTIFLDLDVDPNKVIYTVPEGYTFFLTNLSLQGSTNDDTEGFVYIVRGENILDEASILIAQYLSPELFNVMQNQGTVLNFSMPLKFWSGEKIQFIGDNSSAAYYTASIFGFLEPNSSA